MSQKRTATYVDGFNLYYRALRGTPYKWLDIDSLCRLVLRDDNEIVLIRYYTADISGRDDQQAPVRQQRYLRALRTIPHLSIHKGRFLQNNKWLPLAAPPKGFVMPSPDVVQVRRTEEKGSDVNLASHLLSDAFRDEYDVGVVVSNDTDLVEPIRIVTEDLGKPVGVICPARRIAGELQRVASFVRYLTDARLRAAQFPDKIEGTTLRRPREWERESVLARRELESKLRRALNRGEYADLGDGFWDQLRQVSILGDEEE